MHVLFGTLHEITEIFFFFFYITICTLSTHKVLPTPP